MIFTVKQLINASLKYLDKEVENSDIDVLLVKQYIEFYGELTHKKIRNEKIEGGEENSEFISNEKEFIEYCVYQYELLKDIDKTLAATFKCLVKGAAYIIRLNEKELKEANERAEEFLRQLEVK